MKLILIFFSRLPERFGDLYVGGRIRPFARMKANKEMLNLDNQIIECRFEHFNDNEKSEQLDNGSNGKWVFMRQRKDKSFPNSVNTANGKQVPSFFYRQFLLNTLFKNVFSCLSKYPWTGYQRHVTGLCQKSEIYSSYEHRMRSYFVVINFLPSLYTIFPFDVAQFPANCFKFFKVLRLLN